MNGILFLAGLAAAGGSWISMYYIAGFKSAKYNAEVRLQELQATKKLVEVMRAELESERALRLEPGSGKNVSEAPGYDGPVWGTPPGMQVLHKKKRGEFDEYDEDFVDVIEFGRRGATRISLDMKEVQRASVKYNTELDRARIDVEKWKTVAAELEEEARRLRNEREDLMQAPGAKYGYVRSGFKFTDQWDRACSDGGSYWRNTVSVASAQLCGSSIVYSNEERRVLEAVLEWCTHMNRTLTKAPMNEVYGIWTFETQG